MFNNLQGVGGFVESGYWSSTEADTGNAWFQFFYDGYLGGNYKGSALYVRPVRAF
jgi:hypothetical protein